MGISREELQSKVNEIIFNFGKEYLNVLSQYNEIKNNEDYSEKYKENKRNEFLERVKKSRKESYDKALDVVNTERKKVEDEKKKETKLSIEEKTLKALEKNNLIQMAIIRTKGAAVDILRKVYQESNLDEDVKTIILSELSSRKEKSDEEIILERELKHTVDIFGVVEENITNKIRDTDMVQVSLGNMRSISKDFNIRLGDDYFSLKEKTEHYFNSQDL